MKTIAFATTLTAITALGVAGFLVGAHSSKLEEARYQQLEEQAHQERLNAEAFQQKASLLRLEAVRKAREQHSLVGRPDEVQETQSGLFRMELPEVRGEVVEL